MSKGNKTSKKHIELLKQLEIRLNANIKSDSKNIRKPKDK